MAVDDQNAYLLSCPAAKRITDLPGGGIRILGQQQYPIGRVAPGAADVAVIDAGVGADKTAFMLYDDRPRAGPQHRVAFLEDQFHQFRPFIQVGSQLSGFRARLYFSKVHQPPLSLAHDFLSEHHDVTVFQG